MLPGIPLITLVDLKDMWVQFDLREDLLRDIKVGTKLSVRVPALNDRTVETVVTLLPDDGAWFGFNLREDALGAVEIGAHVLVAVQGGRYLRPGGGDTQLRRVCHVAGHSRELGS